MNQLKEIRQRKGLTQMQVAQKLRISRAAYTNIENGKRDPDTETLCAISDLYGVTVDELLGREPEKTAAPETELDERLMGMLVSLSPEQTQRVLDFVAGMKAADQA